MSTMDDDVFLRDIVVSFLLVGRDTVASALSSFFWLLSQNPAVVKSIREESERVMGGEREKMVSFEQLREMHYLQAAVHESMRLFPPVQFDSKFCEFLLLENGRTNPKCMCSINSSTGDFLEQNGWHYIVNGYGSSARSG